MQAISGAAIDGTGDALERLTASIERGILYSGLLRMEDNNAHDIRVSALQNVGRIGQRHWRINIGGS